LLHLRRYNYPQQFSSSRRYDSQQSPLSRRYDSPQSPLSRHYDGPQQSPLSRRYDDPQRSSSGPVRQCYSCSRFGHIAQYCPNRKNV